MNDASSNGSDHSSSSHGPTSSSNDEASRAAAVGTPEAIREEKKRAQRDQKTAMLDHLVRNIDITIYAQLSALYYME